MLTMRRDPAQNQELPIRREPGGVLMVLPMILKKQKPGESLTLTMRRDPAQNEEPP